MKNVQVALQTFFFPIQVYTLLLADKTICRNLLEKITFKKSNGENGLCFHLILKDYLKCHLEFAEETTTAPYVYTHPHSTSQAKTGLGKRRQVSKYYGMRLTAPISMIQISSLSRLMGRFTCAIGPSVTV